MYLDRIKNEKIEFIPDGSIALGRYMRLEEGKASYLVPNKDGTVLLEGKNMPLHSEILQKLLAKNLEDIAEELSCAESIEEVQTIIPLIRRVDKSVELNDFENFLLEHFFHIENICHHPHQKLTVQHYKMPVSRAKRIPTKAISVLAAHSEDWARRKLRSVVPSRILTTLRDETVDIYENRLTAFLLGLIARYLSERIEQELEKILDFLSVVKNISNIDFKNEKVWYEKISRNFKLLGNAFKGVQKLQEQAQATVDKLKILQDRVLHLFNTELYATCGKARIKGQLLRTNLLVDDQHYRYARMIYEQYMLQDNEEDKQENVELKYQKAIHDFCQFTLLMLLRSLHLLGYKTNEQLPFQENRSYVFEHSKYVEIQITLVGFDCVQLKIGKQTIRFIPIADDWMGKSATPQDFPSDTFIVFNKNLPYLKTENYNNKDFDWLSITPNSSSQALIPVSMENLDSMERIARHIRFYVLNEFLNQYPFKIKIRPSEHRFIKDIKAIELVKGEAYLYEAISEKELEQLRGSRKTAHLILEKANQEFLTWKKHLNKEILPDKKHLTYKTKGTEKEQEYGTFNEGEQRWSYLKIPKLDKIIAANFQETPIFPNPLFLDNLFGSDIISAVELDKREKLRYKRFV